MGQKLAVRAFSSSMGTEQGFPGAAFHAAPNTFQDESVPQVVMSRNDLGGGTETKPRTPLLEKVCPSSWFPCHFHWRLLQLSFVVWCGAVCYYRKEGPLSPLGRERMCPDGMILQEHSARIPLSTHNQTIPLKQCLTEATVYRTKRRKWAQQNGFQGKGNLLSQAFIYPSKPSEACSY